MFGNRFTLFSDSSLGRSPRERVAGFVTHVLRGVALVTVGRLYVSPLMKRLHVLTDTAADEAAPTLRTALVAHVYYADLLEELIECYSKLGPATLIVTTEPSKYDEIAHRLATVRGSRIIACPNRGRDIGPFLMLLNEGHLDEFDAVLKLHTKKSPHLLTGDIRRRLLYTVFAGSHRRARKIMDLFNDPRTGLVGWGFSWRTESAYWMRNRQRVAELSSSMDIKAWPRPAFFEGTMFWVRPAALARLKALDISAETFEVEGRSETDGLLHHAIERLFARIVAADGYVVCTERGRRLLS